MSDFYQKDPGRPMGKPTDTNPWQQDPFAAYDDPSAIPSQDDAPAGDPSAPKVRPDYSAWRRPSPAQGEAPRSPEETGAGGGRPGADAYRPPMQQRPAQPGFAPRSPEETGAVGGRPGADAYRPPMQQRPAQPGFTSRSPEETGAGGGRPGADAYRPPMQQRPAQPGEAPSPRPPFRPNSLPAGEDGGFGVVSATPDQPPQAGKPNFTAYPQQRGPVAPAQPQDASFAALGADAPTRIARPLGQTVNKHVTVDRGTGNPFAKAAAPAQAAPLASPAQTPVFIQPEDSSEGAAPRRRRVSRAARYENGAEPVAPGLASPETPSRAAAGPAFAPLPERDAPAPDFDPFEAGDSEAPSDAVPEEEPARVQRRPAVPGERYTGARTAMPQRRDLPSASGMEEEADSARQPARYDETGRPTAPQGQRPAARYDETGRPAAPQGQRPAARYDETGRPMAPQGMPTRQQARPGQEDSAYGREGEGYDPRRMRPEEEPEGNGRFDLRRNYPDEQPRASVARPRYDFEEEPEEDLRPRRGGVLIPIVVVLLVLGCLLAGILLPDWDGMGGGLGTAMGKIKSAVSGVMDSVKELIAPEEAGVKSFTVSPTAATAPVELVFSVQASTSVTDLRILDQNGQELLSKTLTDSDMLGGEVTKNSKYNIWTLRYTCAGAYSGVFTAQSLKKDGTWSEGMTTTEPVSIAPPVVVEPPVQGFASDTTTGTTPATVGFTITTSLDVSAVQVLNDYGDVVAEAYLSDEGSQMTESESTRTWSLNAQLDNPYTGSFYAAYETDTDVNFTQSDDYRVDVTLTAASAQDGTDAAAEGGEDLTGADAVGGEDLTGADDVGGEDLTGADATDNAALSGDATATDKSANASSLSEEPTEDVGADNPDALAEGDAEAADAAATDAPAETVQPTATPAPTAMPILTATADESAAPSVLKLSTKAYVETKETSDYERANKIVMSEPFKYAVWDQSGVLTFRENSLRQNAAYGTVEITAQSMSELWKVPVEGSVKAKSATLTGVGWPGQAIIVKWPTQLRALLNMQETAKSTQALKEVIVGAQNGKIYFLNLVTGEATRDPIENDWPSNGSLSLDTNATPMLSVGQHIAVLAKKTVDNGLHLYNLLNDKELTLLKGKDKLMQSNYSGFNGAPLFDKNTGTLVVGGENGLLYTMEPGDEFDHIMGSLKLGPTVQKYSWLASKQKAKSTNIDGSVAMYGSYVYFGDQTGIVQCVDVNTLTPVWAVDTGDNVDATIALDMENDTTVSLYTGNTILGQGRTGVCTLRKLDALTGKQQWAFEVPDLAYTTEAEVGLVASPVVGQNKASDLVFYTVTNGVKGGTVYALSKSDGSVRWSLPLSGPAISSPVAVYNAAGDAWLIQAENSGMLRMINALTGTEVGNLQLDGKVEASPAVYRDVLVLSTTGSDPSYIYGIKLE